MLKLCLCGEMKLSVILYAAGAYARHGTDSNVEHGWAMCIAACQEVSENSLLACTRLGELNEICQGHLMHVNKYLTNF